jgi:hypothetical protein
LVSLNPDTFEQIKEKFLPSVKQLQKAYQGKVNFKMVEGLALDEVEIETQD